jgi:uncharacterized protein YjbI with pentapeptide repeats
MMSPEQNSNNNGKCAWHNPEGGPPCNHAASPGKRFCPSHDPKATSESKLAQQTELIAQNDFRWSGFSIPLSIDLSNLNIDTLDFSLIALDGDLILENCYIRSMNLDRAMVKGELKLSHSTISEHLALEGFVLEGKADFSYTHLGVSDLSLSHFNSAADFSNALFSERCVFAITIFEDFVDFSYAVFQSEAHFQGTIFLKQANFYRSRLGRSSFSSTEMDDVSLASADLREVIFNGAVFPKDNRLVEERNAVYPEDYTRAEGVYRAIKQNLQSTGDYEGAGRFFVREMECRRRQLLQNGQWARWLWFGTMKWLCNYGESPPRVFIAVLGTIVTFGIIYAMTGVWGEEGSHSLFDLPMGGIGAILWRALYLSIITFTTVGYGDPRPSLAAQGPAAVEMVLGVFLTAVFVVTFTRRLSR